MVKVKTSSKGQIVIPKEIRDTLGIKPGSILNIRLEGKRIILEPAPPPPDIFVELGESEKILRKAREAEEEKMKRLLRDLGVEGSS